MKWVAAHTTKELRSIITRQQKCMTTKMDKNDELANNNELMDMEHTRRIY